MILFVHPEVGNLSSAGQMRKLRLGGKNQKVIQL
jgi:hypothetical protein